MRRRGRVRRRRGLRVETPPPPSPRSPLRPAATLEASCARGPPALAPRLRPELRRADRAPLPRGAVGRRAGARSSRATSRWSRRAATSSSTRSPPAAGCGSTPRSRPGTRRWSRTAGLARAPGATEPEVRSVALLIEDAGDGARAVRGARRVRRRRHRRRGAEGRGVGGRRRRGRGRTPARSPATSACSARSSREAGAAWADDVHDLLELAKALAVRGARPRGRGLAILTCSGGDSGLGADEAERLGLELPAFAPATVRRARGAAPRHRHDRQPARLHGDDLGRPRLGARPRRARRRGPRRRPGARLLRPPAGPRRRAGRELAGGRGRHPRRRPREPGPGHGRRHPPRAARRRGRRGASPRPACPRSPASAPASPAPPPSRPRRPTRPACARWPPRAGRGVPTDPLRRPPVATPFGGRWLAEHEVKELLRAAGVPVVEGRVGGGGGRRRRRARRARRPRGRQGLASRDPAQGRRRRPRARPGRGARRPRRVPRLQPARRRCSSSGWPRPARS